MPASGMATGDAGVETAKRCVALVFERHRRLVRAICAAKAPIDDRRRPRERRVRAFRARRLPAAHADRGPAGLLVIMARRVVATFHERRKPTGASLDELDDVEADEDGYDQVAADAGGRPAAGGPLGPPARRGVGAAVGRADERRGRGSAWRRRPGNVDVIFFRAMRRLRDGARADERRARLRRLHGRLGARRAARPGGGDRRSGRERARAARGDDRRLPGRAPPHRRLGRGGGRARRRSPQRAAASTGRRSCPPCASAPARPGARS